MSGERIYHQMNITSDPLDGHWTMITFKRSSVFQCRVREDKLNGDLVVIPNEMYVAMCNPFRYNTRSLINRDLCLSRFERRNKIRRKRMVATCHQRSADGISTFNELGEMPEPSSLHTLLPYGALDFGHFHHASHFPTHFHLATNTFMWSHDEIQQFIDA